MSERLAGMAYRALRIATLRDVPQRQAIRAG